MASDKASFYSRDPGAGVSENKEDGDKPYAGEERRRKNRRDSSERRGEVRFEMNKTDRREVEGRRDNDKTPKYW